MQLNMQQILRLFGNPRPVVPRREVPKLVTFSLKNCPQILQSFHVLDWDLKLLFKELFNNDQQQKDIVLRDLLPFMQRKTPMPVCNKLFHNREQVYRCYDCMTHQAAVYCLQCFENSNHRGHRFVKIDSGGGNCDCGNPDALKQEGFCKHHKGKADQMIIDESQELQFKLYFRQLFIWTLELYQQGIKDHSQLLLLHTVIVLDWLNTESLYYNTLTNKLLFSNQNQIIQHIFVIGNKGKQKMLGKKATQLFLKMFSLEVFKENISIAYLKAFNTLEKFQHSQFQKLFIQLFANVQLVQKVVQKSGLSLNPRDRQFNFYKYYNSIAFVGTIKQQAARCFMAPIMKSGGIPFRLIQHIQKDCQQEGKPIHQIYSETVNHQNMFYQVQKVQLKLFRNQRNFIVLSLRNLYNNITKYSFNKNKVVISYQRMFIMNVFVYFAYDVQSSNPIQLAKVLQINPEKLAAFLQKILQCFVYCLNELAGTLAEVSGQHPFESYLNLYVRNLKSQVPVIYDMLGVKFCLVCLKKLQLNYANTQILAKFLIQPLHSLKMRHRSLQSVNQTQNSNEAVQTQKINSLNKTQFLHKIHFLNVLIETIVSSRGELIIANQLSFKESQLIKQIYEQQLLAIMLNLKEVSLPELQVVGLIWFGAEIDKTVLYKFTSFNSAKKKFTINQSVLAKGVPFCQEFMISLKKCPVDRLIKNSQSLQLLVTSRIASFRQKLLAQESLKQIYQTLIQLLRLIPREDFSKCLKQLSVNLKCMSLLFEQSSPYIEQAIELIVNIIKSEKQTNFSQILSIFQKGRLQQKSQDNKQQAIKRKELMKQKKQQKLSQMKMKEQMNKFLHQKAQKIQEQHEQQTCIFCRQTSKEKPLCYMGSLFTSNIIFSKLKLPGSSPFFRSCFHPVHFDCFITVCKGKDKTQCPLCKSVSNILIPTQQAIQNKQLLKQIKTRMDTIIAINNTNQIADQQVQRLKSLLQMTLSCLIDKQKLTQKQIRLHKIILKMAQNYYVNLDENNKKKFLNSVRAISNNYHVDSTQQYNLGLLMILTFSLAIEKIKNNQISIQTIRDILGEKPLLPKKDLSVALNVISKLYNLQIQIEDLIDSFNIDEEITSLSDRITFYRPPKSIKQLLQVRKQEAQICKMGHQICVCIICNWKGCLTCQHTRKHAEQVHSKSTLFFNYLTGGLHCFQYGLLLDTRSLYVNQLDQSWLPHEQNQDYFFDMVLYDKLITAIKSANLLEEIRNQYVNLKGIR